MDSAVIELTSSAIKENRLDIRACGPDFFPHDAIGASSVGGDIGLEITLLPKGLSTPIKTDIPRDRRSGRPRWIFRKRGWVGDFIPTTVFPSSST